MQIEAEAVDSVQKRRLNRALGITGEQINQAKALLNHAGLTDHAHDPRLLSAVITALAMNYGAEVHSLVGAKG